MASQMASFHNTVEDDDDDICPVCDGDCTCHTPSTSIQQQQHQQQRPVLKIKLPPAPSKPQTTSAFVHDGAQPPAPVPKRRGRPPKNRDPNAQPSTSTYQRPKQPAARRPPPPKKPSTKKKAARKPKHIESDESSDLTDVDTNDDLEPPPQFPTFVPASAVPSIVSNSSAEDSDSATFSSDFDSDSSIEAEEENFIVAEEERARVRRELFGEESLQKRRDNRNDNWVIRPRKTSVGAPSDVDMDVDSDATEDADEDDEEEEEDDEDDEDEADSSVAGPSYSYSGLATSWSDDEDEESSFDADIFFANLSDSARSSSDSDSGSTTQSDDATQDGDQSDLEGLAASIIPHLRQQGLINLPFEVAEGWDGQVVFTNGIGESGIGYLDAPHFEVVAPPEMSASPSADGDADVDMLSTDADEEGYEQDVDLDTAEGEGDGDTTDEDLVGDDDLPNERAMRLFNTPFSFSTVSSINPLSTMSPVATSRRRASSTASSVDSPRPADILAGRVSTVIWEDAEEHDHSDEHLSAEDPIEKERRERDKEIRGGMPRTGVFEIEVLGDGQKAKQAIIDDQRKEIPSPHPRFKGRGERVLGFGRHKMSMSHSSSTTGFESLLRRSFSSPLRPSSLPPPSTRFSLSSDLPLSSYNSDAPLAVTSPEPGDVSPTTMPIDLSDVLDPSFLAAADPLESNDAEAAPVPPDTPNPGAGDMSSTDTEDQANHRHMRNLNRWDLISVGAFRKTREAIVVGSPGYISDAPATPSGWSESATVDYEYNNRYRDVLRPSPLTTMLWHNKNGQKQMQNLKAEPFSPELLPIGGSSKDGDRTPTAHSGTGLQPAFTGPSPKTRKELRKERKLKRKSGAGVHTSHKHTSQHQQRHQHHHTTKMRQHHNHGHYANMKSRSGASVQRTNFFSSPVPSLSI